jgi:hypothetical protein
MLCAVFVIEGIEVSASNIAIERNPEEMTLQIYLHSIPLKL